MSKLRALELAVGLFTGRADMQPTAVLEQAKLYAEFLADEPTEAQRVKAAAKESIRARKAADVSVAVADTPAETVAPVTQEDVNVAHAAAKQVADDALAAAKAKSAAAQAAAQQAATAPVPGEVTQDQIKQVVGKLAVNAAAGGAPKVRAILGTFDGATNISTLKPVHYAAAKAAIEAVLEAAELAG